MERERDRRRDHRRPPPEQSGHGPSTDLQRRLADAEARAGALNTELAALRAEWDLQLARLEERLAAAEAACAHRDRERAEARERERHLLALLAEALAERRERRPWPGWRAWWRRVWEGQG